MDLITVENGTALLTVEASYELAQIERQLKAVSAYLDNMKQAILAEMEQKGIIKLDTEELSISYIAPTDRETFDSKAFKKAHADLYDEFVFMKPVKSSIRIKVKD